MSAAPAIRLEAEVDVRERPAIVAAVQQLAEALHAATGREWPLQLRFWRRGGDLLGAAEDSVVLLSMLPDAESDEPMDAVAQRWREQLEALTGAGALVFVINVFRGVPDRLSEAGQRTLERIRRLNRLAPDLSQNFGVALVDIDRTFAHIGARNIASDYRLGGKVAAEVAGHAVTLALLSMGLDAWVDLEDQEKAMTFHRPLREIDIVVRRRLARA